MKRAAPSGAALPSFAAIRARAAKRKGGDAALAALLPRVQEAKTLAR